MRTKISILIGQIALLLKKYNELRQIQENNIYRLADIKTTSSGKYEMLVQVIGKSTILECTPQEIVTDDSMLEGFSKKDIRTITYYACEQIKKPKYKVMVQEFSEKIDSMIFKLKEVGNSESIVKTANQIIKDKHLIDGLSKEDITSVSYIAGYECSQNKN